MPPDFEEVQTMDDFIIPFKGLSTGSHRFEFKIENSFFESFEYFESEKGQVKVGLEMIKESSLLDLHILMEGIVSADCDRCLEPAEFPVKGSFRLIVKFGGEFEEESDEVVLIPITESRLDLHQFLFEYINLMLPIKKVHADKNQCDQKIIEKLEEYSEPETDPRWEALKKIKLK